MRLKDGQTLVFFGDSITRRSEIKDAADPRVKFSLNYDDSYVDLFLQRLVIHYPRLDLKTYNLGVGGDTVNGLMERFWELEALKPDWVVLCIGQNDAKTLSPAQFEQQLSYLLEQLTDLGCRVVQLTTTPCPYSREKEEKLLVFDETIRRLGRSLFHSLPGCQDPSAADYAGQRHRPGSHQPVCRRMPSFPAGEPVSGGYGVRLFYGGGLTNPGKIGYTFPKLARTKEEYSRYSGKESARLVKG